MSLCAEIDRMLHHCAGDNHFVEKSAHDAVHTLQRVSLPSIDSSSNAAQHSPTTSTTSQAELSILQSPEGIFDIAEEYNEALHGPLKHQTTPQISKQHTEQGECLSVSQ